MKLPTESDIENIKKTVTAKGTCANSVAMIFCNDKQIISCSNAMIKQDDPTAHASIVATRLKHREIRNAGEDCYIFLSEKPCPMCVSGIYQARMNHLYFLENDKIKHMDLRIDNIDGWYEEVSVVTNK
jgi:tRNA(Arg) A34 adenosine deaminase TadA